MTLDSEKCPKCDGRTIIPYGLGHATCTSCGGSGLNHKTRKKNALANKQKALDEYLQYKDKYDEFSAAVEAFKPVTNLDYVLVEHLQDRLHSMGFKLTWLRPKGYRD